MCRITSVLLCALVAVSAGVLVAGEPPPPPPPVAPVAGEEAWKADIRKKLDKKVTFEFIDTPYDEALNFLRSLADVTLIVEPRAVAAAKPISLRVTATSIADALTWITRMQRQEWVLMDQAIWIQIPKEAQAENEAREVAEKKQRHERMQQHQELQRLMSTARIHVKLPDGREIEADGLNPFSAVAEQIMEQTLNPAKDGLVVLRLQPNPQNLSDEELLALIKKAAPKASPEVDAKTRLLLVRSEDAVSLRRVTALLRDLSLKRGAQVPPPLGAGGGMPFEGRRFDFPPPVPPPPGGPQGSKKEKEPGEKGDF